ncbi:TPA: replication initiation factor domain-containing protein, partial [Staphylococcus pseudintermedius]|nr:replication initiation factor domain-containing protein [Staphylococcus pseudintermedius]HDT8444644.1 replication initiation factor domain-containing protein [Staphylococcus pseudintermedius]
MEQKNLSTPLTNRGVARPNESAVKAVVDWVQVTFHVGAISAIVSDVIGLPFDLFKHQEKGLYFYNRTYEFSNIKLYYSSNDESMGIHL